MTFYCKLLWFINIWWGVCGCFCALYPGVVPKSVGSRVTQSFKEKVSCFFVVTFSINTQLQHHLIVCLKFTKQVIFLHAYRVTHLSNYKKDECLGSKIKISLQNLRPVSSSISGSWQHFEHVLCCIVFRCVDIQILCSHTVCHRLTLKKP